MTPWSGQRAALQRLAVIAIASLCVSTAQASAQLNEVNPRVGFTSVSKAYPDMDARYVRIGTPRTIEQVRSIAVGQSKVEIQAALGRPAVRNGDGSFEFHLSLPLTGRDRLICQYRVFFDNGGNVSRAVWRRPQCADLVAGNRN
ncbi:hypothetical protein [Paracoccus binzhouensis]|uniref:hypothetical protein n=1 Tax=Paracoccus binzhouensis TaxID=2796149 RepID=UPI0018EED5CA|nr:hypothetical protein [Paracoccus binzhouensis]